jgi:hypothetical protein
VTRRSRRPSRPRLILEDGSGEVNRPGPPCRPPEGSPKSRKPNGSSPEPFRCGRSHPFEAIVRSGTEQTTAPATEQRRTFLRERPPRVMALTTWRSPDLRTRRRSTRGSTADGPPRSLVSCPCQRKPTHPVEGRERVRLQFEIRSNGVRAQDTGGSWSIAFEGGWSTSVPLRTTNPLPVRDGRGGRDLLLRVRRGADDGARA